MKRLTIAAAIAGLSLLLAGCPIYSSKHPRGVSDRALCRQVYDAGGCSPSCKRQPSWCGQLEFLRCDSTLCWWKSRDGALIVRLAEPVPAPVQSDEVAPRREEP